MEDGALPVDITSKEGPSSPLSSQAALIEACKAGQTDAVLSLVRTHGADLYFTAEKVGRPALFYVAEGGHVATLRALVLELGVSVDALADTYDRSTLLHVAAEAGHCEAVRALIQLGANVHTHNDGWGSPAHTAASHGRTNVIRMLVNEFGVDVEDRGVDEYSEQYTMLHVAASFGQDETVRVLVKELRADVNAVSADGSTPLHEAAIGGFCETIRLLERFGADVNATTKQGQTPLHCAALCEEEGVAEAMRVLYELGAYVNVADVSGDTPLHIAAAQCDNAELLRVMAKELRADVRERNNRRWTALDIAANCGYTESVRVLIKELGAVPNMSEENSTFALAAAANTCAETIRLLGSSFFDDHHKTKSNVLLWAAENGWSLTVRVLAKDFGVRVNPWGLRGDSPIHSAASRGKTEVVRLLVEELGARVDVRDNRGNTLARIDGGDGIRWDEQGAPVATGVVIEDECGDTALHIAAARGHCTTARLLAQMGASVHACNKDGLTPLLLATEGGHVDVARMLITEAGADMNARDSRGYTCLHTAASKGHIEMIRAFLVLGASVTAVCARGRTPLHLAVTQGGGNSSTTAVRLLMDAAADVGARSADGRTALHYAAMGSRNGCGEAIRAIAIASSEASSDLAADVRDREMRTPLHDAAAYGSVEAVTVLVKELGAAVEARDGLGRTPLHIAAAKGCEVAVSVLVHELGARVDVVDNDGATPRECTLQCNTPHSNAIARMLRAVRY